MNKTVIGFVLGTSTLAVVVALIVVATTRPSDAELRREVATDLGVPTEILELPLVDQVLTDVSDQSRETLTEELRTSLLAGAAAGGLTAMTGALLAARHLQSARNGPSASHRAPP